MKVGKVILDSVGILDGVSILNVVLNKIQVYFYVGRCFRRFHFLVEHALWGQTQRVENAEYILRDG
jgi:hypothetical protein